MNSNLLESIAKTKKGFEESFAAGAFYNKQTQDKKHLEMIMNYVQIDEGMKILDLGTGTGYLAFAFAKKYPNSKVIGLDIVEKALARNVKRAENEGLGNLKFVNYNGLSFPFADKSFNMVMTRYALHHFPEINNTFKEISRVLKPNGKLFLVDPTPNDDDNEGFVDAYMQMKKDGHIKFYSKEEWKTIGESAGLQIIDGFETKIRFPKKRDTALEFDNIMMSFSNKIIKEYSVEIIDDEIWITEKVNNLLFEKVR